MTARIYRPAKNATQSGMGKTKLWRLEFMPESARSIEPLMGWTSSSDMNSQIKLNFETREEAVAYANATAFPIASRSPRKSRAAPSPIPTISAPIARRPWTH